MTRSINFKHLLYFWQIAKSGSMARASEQLHLAPQTLSSQIALLEDDLGVPLFVKHGRKLELTQAGRRAFDYAQDIFALGAELKETLQHYPENGSPAEFRVGIAATVSKTIAYRLIEPATRMADPVRIVCRELKMESLLQELAMSRLDLVIACAPVPHSAIVRASNHRLGQSGASFFGSSKLLRSLKGDFPGCIDGAPVLFPTTDTPLRGRLDQWCEAHNLRPRVVGEFDDPALMKTFGQRGAGIFVGPTVLESEIAAQYRVKTLGRTGEIVEEYFAITVDRRLTHPCVLTIHKTAKEQLF